MTTSGETTYNRNRDVIVKMALRKVGAITPLKTPDGSLIGTTTEALNMMIKAWQIQGFMWLQEYVTLFLQKGQRVYELPGANGATSYVESTITADLVASDVVIPVADTTGIGADFIVGIYLDDGTLHWDTVASVDSSIQLTLDNGIASAASSGAVLYAYSTSNAIYRPTRIFSAQRVYDSGNEVPLNPLARDEYSHQVSKETNGTPTQYYFDRQLNPAKLYIWQPPQNASNKLVLDMDRPLEVMIDSLNTFDFPQEWIECIAYGLAVRIAPEHAVPLGERQELKREFSAMVDNLLSYNRDWTPIYFGVDNG